jgi:hypothetical protein
MKDVQSFAIGSLRIYHLLCVYVFAQQFYILQIFQYVKWIQQWRGICNQYCYDG